MYLQRQLNLDENKVQDFIEVRSLDPPCNLYSLIIHRHPPIELILKKHLWLVCLLLGMAFGIPLEATGYLIRCWMRV
jgi:hypothetical protein